MALIADIILIAASLGLAVYCIILSRRLSRFTDLEKGVGGAVAVLSAQVDDLTRALRRAQDTAQNSAAKLTETTERAEDAARRLELHVAALHDLPGRPQGGASSRTPDVGAAAVERPADRAQPTVDIPIAFHRAAMPDLVADTPGPAPETPVETGAAMVRPSIFSTHRHIQPGVLG